MKEERTNEKSIHKGPTRLIAGLTTGLISTILFNPIDKALYLFSAKNASLLSLETWKRPYQGVHHAIINRTVSYGLYYSLLDYYGDLFKRRIGTTVVSSSVNNDLFGKIMPGIATGMTTAILTNPINLIKHYGWNSGLPVVPIIQTVKVQEGLIKGLTRGLGMTISRDILFTVPYNVGYQYAKSKIKDPSMLIATNVAISCGCTVICSPLNYVRSMKYAATCYKQNPKAYQIVKDLVNAVNELEGVSKKIRYISRSFCLGPGTLRVGLGISLGQYLYERVLRLISTKLN